MVGSDRVALTYLFIEVPWGRADTAAQTAAQEEVVHHRRPRGSTPNGASLLPHKPTQIFVSQPTANLQNEVIKWVYSLIQGNLSLPIPRIPPLPLVSIADTVNLIKHCSLKYTLSSVFFLYPSSFLQIYLCMNAHMWICACECG